VAEHVRPSRGALSCENGMLALQQSLAHMYFFYIVHKFPEHFAPAVACPNQPRLVLRTRFNKADWVPLNPLDPVLECCFDNFIRSSKNCVSYDVQLDLNDDGEQSRNGRVVVLYFPCRGACAPPCAGKYCAFT
jgi:hypothetical protein